MKNRSQIEDQQVSFKLQNIPKIQEISQEQSVPNKDEAIHKKSYNVVTYDMRVKLINLSGKKGYSISRAARQLGIKPSTGKFIVKSFRDQGKIMKKNINVQNIKQVQAQENKLIHVTKQDLPIKRKIKKLPDTLPAKATSQDDSQRSKKNSGEKQIQKAPVLYKNEYNNYFIHVIDPSMYWNNGFQYNPNFYIPQVSCYSTCEYQNMVPAFPYFQ